MIVETNQKPTARRYSPELKERAVRMVLTLRQETGSRNGCGWRMLGRGWSGGISVLVDEAVTARRFHDL